MKEIRRQRKEEGGSNYNESQLMKVKRLKLSKYFLESLTYIVIISNSHTAISHSPVVTLLNLRFQSKI